MNKNTRKILLALLVVFTLLMSMATVTAFADDSATADDGTTIYFENNWLWTDVCCYYWGDGIAAPEWPGIPMDNVGMANGHEVYSFNVPTGVTGIIINGLKDDNSGNRDQTPDIVDGIVDGAGWKMEWADGNLVDARERAAEVFHFLAVAREFRALFVHFRESFGEQAQFVDIGLRGFLHLG